MAINVRSRESVLRAIEECDRLGRAEFLRRYGFRPATKFVLVYKEQEYDPKAIVGVAYGYENVAHGPLKSKGDGLSGGWVSNHILHNLGFEVREINKGAGNTKMAEASVGVRTRLLQTPAAVSLSQPQATQVSIDTVEDDEPREPGARKPAKVPQSPEIVHWVERLVASHAYKKRKDSMRRHVPDDDVVRRCLVALNSGGGIMTPVAFCEATDLPAARLDGLMAHVQRLLNVDGYDVLVFSRTENRIEINVAKLQRQFDLE